MTTRPDIQIRQSTQDDYQAIADIYNAIDPDDPRTAEGIADQDRRRDPKCLHQRWVATYDQSVVGTAIFTQNANTYDPHRFSVGVQVLPSFRRRGIGTILINTVESQLVEHAPKELRAFVREDWVAGLYVLESRGFREHTRMAESHLEIEAFDASPFTEIDSKLQRTNIEIKTLRELEDDPDRNRKLHELDWELGQDVPDAVDYSKVELDTWVNDTINDPGFLPDAYFVATSDGEFIGMSVVFKNEADDTLRHGMTGVTSAFRRKGIALALKVKTILYAKSQGHPVIKTYNEVNNAPMLAINNRLGFVTQPSWIQFMKNCS